MIRFAGIVLMLSVFLGIPLGSAEAGGAGRLLIDGKLTPHRLEPVRARGFPGHGSVYLGFMPQKIPHKGCGFPCIVVGPGPKRLGMTGRHGAANFVVRVPRGYVLERRRKRIFVRYREGDRVRLVLSWFDQRSGAGRGASASAVVQYGRG